MTSALINHFAAGGATLRKAVKGLTRREITKPMEPGRWSVLELVVHMADSDAVLIDRMKRIIAEDNPPLLSFDENLYIARLHCHEQSLEDALMLFEVGRRQFTRVLRKLTDADFARVGTHNVRGAVSVAALVKMCSDHLDHHGKFLLGKRQQLLKLRKPARRKPAPKPKRARK